jgi:hypothetical protein
MTIDARLEKLVVRHEALSQTVELIGAMWTQEHVDLLLSVAANHEQRIKGIEGG